MEESSHDILYKTYNDSIVFSVSLQTIQDFQFLNIPWLVNLFSGIKNNISEDSEYTLCLIINPYEPGIGVSCDNIQKQLLSFLSIAKQYIKIKNVDVIFNETSTFEYEGTDFDVHYLRFQVLLVGLGYKLLQEFSNFTLGPTPTPSGKILYMPGKIQKLHRIIPFYEIVLPNIDNFIYTLSDDRSWTLDHGDHLDVFYKEINEHYGHEIFKDVDSFKLFLKTHKNVYKKEKYVEMPDQFPYEISENISLELVSPTYFGKSSTFYVEPEYSATDKNFLVSEKIFRPIILGIPFFPIYYNDNMNLYLENLYGFETYAKYFRDDLYPLDDDGRYVYRETKKNQSRIEDFINKQKTDIKSIDRLFDIAQSNKEMFWFLFNQQLKIINNKFNYLPTEDIELYRLFRTRPDDRLINASKHNIKQHSNISVQKKKTKKLILLGDSWGVNPNLDESKPWSDELLHKHISFNLQNKLNEYGIEVINLSINGSSNIEQLECLDRQISRLIDVEWVVWLHTELSRDGTILSNKPYKIEEELKNISGIIYSKFFKLVNEFNAKSIVIGCCSPVQNDIYLYGTPTYVEEDFKSRILQMEVPKTQMWSKTGIKYIENSNDTEIEKAKLLEQTISVLDILRESENFPDGAHLGPKGNDVLTNLIIYNILRNSEA